MLSVPVTLQVWLPGRARTKAASKSAMAMAPSGRWLWLQVRFTAAGAEVGKPGSWVLWAPGKQMPAKP
jgi:hypothetical protein